jgi:2-(1,2-epoxy-1,2-dihydrophenyl)acetyl-CoA isomerase
MGESIKITQNDDLVIIKLNRPKYFNSFDLELIKDFFGELSGITKDDKIRGVIVSGEGKSFCAGGDLNWMVSHPSGPSAALHQLAAYFHLAVLELRRMAKPVIAAINGIAAGGGFSLALACDFRVMGESAIMRQAYTSNGLCIDGGGTFVLPRIIGTARAMEIAAFDEPISSEKALSWGLVTKVAKDNEVMEDAIKLAFNLSKGSLHSYGWSKRLINNSFDTSLETQLEQERLGIEACANHPDGQEGITAFQEKRKPSF